MHEAIGARRFNQRMNATPDLISPFSAGAGLPEAITEDGCALLPPVDKDILDALTAALEAADIAGRQRHGAVYAIRNLLEAVPAVAEFARSAAALEFVMQVLGPNCFPVRGLLFDKNASANWSVPWHQDLAIAVRERKEVEGFSAWTVKEGVFHVQPPASILESMVTLRLHLDPCGAANGPLRVLQGSHRYGRLSPPQIDDLRQRSTPRDMTAASGEILIMRPLLLHSSSVADDPSRRRVIHLEYAAGLLPSGLEWHCISR